MEKKQTVFYGFLGCLLVVVLLGILINRPVKSEVWNKPYCKDFSDCMNSGYCLYGSTPDCDVPDRGYLPKRMFCELPPKPDNFDRYKFFFEYGYITDVSTVPENIWMQPEFLSNWDLQLSNMQCPDITHLVLGSVRVYPRTIMLELEREEIAAEEEYEFAVPFTVRSEGMTTFYRGMRLIPIFPGGEVSDSFNSFSDGQNWAQNPPDVQEILEVRFEPEIFTLAPSFPVFKKDYVKLVTAYVKVKKAVPGKYVFFVGVDSPPRKYNEEQKMKYFNESIYKSITEMVYFPEIGEKIFVWLQ